MVGVFSKSVSRESSTANMISFGGGREGDCIANYNIFVPLLYLYCFEFLGFLYPRWCPTHVKSRLVGIHHGRS